MRDNKEMPEEMRKRLRLEEMKRNPPSSYKGSGLDSLFEGFNWKVSLAVIGALIIGIVIYKMISI